MSRRFFIFLIACVSANFVNGQQFNFPQFPNFNGLFQNSNFPNIPNRFNAQEEPSVSSQCHASWSRSNVNYDNTAQWQAKFTVLNTLINRQGSNLISVTISTPIVSRLVRAEKDVWKRFVNCLSHNKNIWASREIIKVKNYKKSIDLFWDDLLLLQNVSLHLTFSLEQQNWVWLKTSRRH